MAIASVINEGTLAASATSVAKLTMGTNPGQFSVMWTVRDATAVGDLGATVVNPIAKDGTVLPISLTPTSTEAAVLSGSTAVKIDYFDVPGLEKIQVSITNGAASDRNVIVDVVFNLS